MYCAEGCNVLITKVYIKYDNIYMNDVTVTKIL